jgi:RNA polymerase sigma factor (sigma-70 family)
MMRRSARPVSRRQAEDAQSVQEVRPAPRPPSVPMTVTETIQLNLPAARMDRGSVASPEPGRLDLQSTFELTALARAGDQAALEALCLRCLKSLNRYASGRLPASIRPVIETQDIVLEAVQKGLSRLHEFDYRHEGALIGFMRRILRNLIIDHLRHAGRRPLQVPLDEQQPAEAGTPLENLLEDEQFELYEMALERLKSRDAELIRLKIDEQLGYAEIAQQLGLRSDNAARIAVKRAVLRIAHEMSTLRSGGVRPRLRNQP